MWRSGESVSEYVLCDPSRNARACGLLQSASAGGVDQHSPSGRNVSTREHLRAIATEALELISGRDCSALDIGCNDGTLLSYYPRWVERFGVDPADPVDDIGEWAWTAKDAFPSSDLNAAFGEKKFDIITAVSVFEFSDQPKNILDGVKSLLTDDGVFVLETLYAPMVLTRNSVESLQAGVSAAYSLATLEWLVRDAGLKIFKGQVTNKEGGSIRLFITHKDNEEFDFDPWYERLATLWDEENVLAMRSIQPYQSFEHRIEDVHGAYIDLLENIAGRSETVNIIGADAQAEALVTWAGKAGSVITAAIDTPAAREQSELGDLGIPVISEADARATEPDFLIAPTRFKREVLERWREAVLLGAKIMFVTPTPHVVDAANYASEFGKVLDSGGASNGVATLRSILSLAEGPRLVADNSGIEKSA